MHREQYVSIYPCGRYLPSIPRETVLVSVSRNLSFRLSRHCTRFLSSLSLAFCVQPVENSCLQSVCNGRNSDRLTPLFGKCGWLDTKQRCLIYKPLNTGLFNLVYHSVNSRPSRSQSSISIPLRRSSEFQASFSYISVNCATPFPTKLHDLSQQPTLLSNVPSDLSSIDVLI